MTRFFRTRFWRFCLVVAATLTLSVTGCGLIDEALEICREEFSLRYRLRLILNLRSEIDDQLDDERDLPIRLALEDHLKNIFAEFAHDVDLSFYDVDAQGQRLEHRSAIMDAGQATYEIELPPADYRHLALANLMGNQEVKLEEEALRDSARLVQVAGLSLPSHETGLFTARQPITVHRNEDRTFEVNLYMANDAGALVVHRDSCDYQAIRADLLDLADRFRITDSLYSYGSDAVIEADLVDVEPFVAIARQQQGGTKAGEADSTGTPEWKKTPALLCGVGFPSRDQSIPTATVPGTVWRMALYVTLRDGSVTQSVIAIDKPLQAGSVVVIRGWLRADGSFVPGPPPGPGPEPPEDHVVGVSVMLDWQQGMHFEPVL